MRIWEIEVSKLCNRHLLAEHRELHAIRIYLTTTKGGNYKKHPETLRWVGKLGLLSKRHKEQVAEFKKRGWNHKTDFEVSNSDYGLRRQRVFVNTLAEQVEILRAKGCLCRV